MSNKSIVVTGAAGFIGSCMVSFLNKNGFNNLYIVDDFSKTDKDKNWKHLQYTEAIDRSVFVNWLNQQKTSIDCIIHLGARTDTTEFDYSVHDVLNVQYSKSLWQYCTQNKVPFLYASSAATYGDGELGYNDDHQVPFELKPLNPYGVSKNEFDKWALQQTDQPPFWAGYKFFNVYGPNEYHKGRMASVIWHAFNQIQQTGKVKLFKSHKEGFKDGQQLRDFVYVKDVVNVIYWMMQQVLQQKQTPQLTCGLYNLGTGIARSFEDLVKATFAGLQLPANIEFIDMPLDIRDKYQYFTEANMQKLINAGYTTPFYSLEDGVGNYVTAYLSKNLSIY